MFKYLFIADAIVFLTMMVQLTAIFWANNRILCNNGASRCIDALVIHMAAPLILLPIGNAAFIHAVFNGEMNGAYDPYLVPLILVCGGVMPMVASLRVLCEWLDRDKLAQAAGHGDTDCIYPRE